MEFYIDSPKEDSTKQDSTKERALKPESNPFQFQHYRYEAGDIYITFLKRDLISKYKTNILLICKFSMSSTDFPLEPITDTTRAEATSRTNAGILI